MKPITTIGRAEHPDRDPVGQVEPCVLCEEGPEPEAFRDLVEHRPVGVLLVRHLLTPSSP